MESSVFHLTTANLCCSSFPSSISTQQRPSSFKCQIHSLPRGLRRGPLRLSQRKPVKCAKLGLGGAAELERELEEEMKMNPDEKAEWMRFGNCGGRGGIVELLECLEREAIMGEDQGREPDDYNRRAQIFDRSSRVFQALKERNGTPTQES